MRCRDRVTGYRSACVSISLSLSFLLIATLPLRAGLSQQALEASGFHFKAGALLPLGVTFDSPAGPRSLGEFLRKKPALLDFVDYRCRSFCGVVLDRLAVTLPALKLRLGQDYNLLTIALDDHQTQKDAQAFARQHAQGSLLQKQALFLTENASARQALEVATGLQVPFDPAHQKLAHPIGLVLVDSGGRAMQVLNPLALDPLDLGLALTAGKPILSLSERLHLLCYGWDAQKGIYTLQIQRILSVMAAISVLILGGVLGWLHVQERKLRVSRPVI